MILTFSSSSGSVHLDVVVLFGSLVPSLGTLALSFFLLGLGIGGGFLLLFLLLRGGGRCLQDSSHFFFEAFDGLVYNVDAVAGVLVRLKTARFLLYFVDLVLDRIVELEDLSALMLASFGHFLVQLVAEGVVLLEVDVNLPIKAASLLNGLAQLFEGIELFLVLVPAGSLTVTIQPVYGLICHLD